MINVSAPASKSLSHRYLIASALADGRSAIANILDSDDTTRTREILSCAGARFIETGRDSGPTGGLSFEVTGVSGRLRGAPSGADPRPCFVNESGTTCRLLTAVLASGRGCFRICGAPRLENRPIGELVQALRALGSDISCEREGFPPLVIEAHGFTAPPDGLPVSMDESSQYFSGLLLAAPMTGSPLTLCLEGNKVVSWPYIGLTLQCMADFGITFQVQTRMDPQDDAGWNDTPWQEVQQARPGCLRILVRPSRYVPGSFRVEGDWSGASYFVAAGALGTEAVHIGGLRTASLQGDRALIDILSAMGAKISSADGGEAVIVTPSPLHGIDIDMGSCPDLVPTIAAVAAFADGDTRIRNVAHLRIKECDRIAAPAAGLRKIGARCDEQDDGLVIHGLGSDARISIGSTVFAASNDHRMAMSQALYSLRATDCTPARIQSHIDTPTVVRKSFPGFWQAWEAFCRV